MSQDIYNTKEFSIQEEQMILNRYSEDSITIAWSDVKKITILKDFTNSLGQLILFLAISLCTFLAIYFYSEINKLGGINEVVSAGLFFDGGLNSLNTPLLGIVIIGLVAPNLLKRRIIGVINTDQNTYRLVFNERNQTDNIDLVLKHLKGKLSENQFTNLLT